MAKLAPSILSCDFSRLKEQLLAAQAGGANIIHVDVMDGHFVPNITFGVPIVEAVRKILPQATIDVHLMIENPRRYVPEFAKAGADIISFHMEAEKDFDATINLIKKQGKKAAVALCPGTPVELISETISKLEMVLLLTVNPGFGGQKLLPGMDEKILKLRREITRRGLRTEIEIDGGVKEENIEYLASRGASIIVAGSLVFSDEEKIEEKVKRLSLKIEPY